MEGPELIGDLKSLVCSKGDLPAQESAYVLTYQGRILDEACTAEMYRIEVGTAVYLALKADGTLLRVSQQKTLEDSVSYAELRVDEHRRLDGAPHSSSEIPVTEVMQRLEEFRA